MTTQTARFQAPTTFEMLEIFGIDPVELGGAPFALAIDRALTVTAAELGIALHPNARVYALPCIAGHVGADTAGVILA